MVVVDECLKLYVSFLNKLLRSTCDNIKFEDIKNSMPTRGCIIGISQSTNNQPQTHSRHVIDQTMLPHKITKHFRIIKRSKYKALVTSYKCQQNIIGQEATCRHLASSYQKE
jgi:hypothetical protein